MKHSQNNATLKGMKFIDLLSVQTNKVKKLKKMFNFKFNDQPEIVKNVSINSSLTTLGFSPIKIKMIKSNNK